MASKKPVYGLRTIELLVSYKYTCNREDDEWHTEIFYGDSIYHIYGKTMDELAENVMDQYEPKGQCSCFYKNEKCENVEYESDKPKS